MLEPLRGQQWFKFDPPFSQFCHTYVTLMGTSRQAEKHCVAAAKFPMSHMTVTWEPPSTLDLFMQLNHLRLLPLEFPWTVPSMYDITSEKKLDKSAKISGTRRVRWTHKSTQPKFLISCHCNFWLISVFMHDPYLEYVIYIGVFFLGREINRKGLI